MIELAKKVWEKRIIRFFFVGGINTLFGYGVFSFFIFLHFNYVLAALFATILGILFNFNTIGKLVFKKKNNKLIIKFICVYVITYLLNILGLRIFNNFGISNYISGAILILPMSLIAYLLNSRFVFNESRLLKSETEILQKNFNSDSDQGKKMKKIVHKYVIVVLFIIFALVPVITLSSGVPFKYDWAWPIFDLKQFWDALMGSGSFGLFSALSKNGPALFGILGLFHFPPSLFFKIFIFLVHFVAGYGFYLFIKNRVKSETVAIISGLAYAFTPYLFIRTIIGFTWSMVAYAVLPIFLLKFFKTEKKILDYFIIGFLLSLIFCQTQAGLLTFLIITVCSIINLFSDKRLFAIKNYFLSFLSLVIVSLPWMIVMLFRKSDLTVVSGKDVTTLGFIASLPHSFRNFLMLSDHHITSNFFYPLAHNKLFILGWLIVWFVAFCAIFNKKNRITTFTFLISSLLVLPFIKGPLGIFGNFYIRFYYHFPQIAVFRETYHFEFLYAIALCVLFAFGLDFIWQKIDHLKSKALIRTGLKSLFAGSAIFIIAPYLTFDYAGYFNLQKIPTEYTELHDYFQSNKEVCHKIYYPPGLGFIYFKNDKSGAASNSDTLANSLGVPYLTDGTSVLNLPSDDMFYRNELVSQFYEKGEDNGQFTSLLNEGGIDCVVLRLDTETRYVYSSNLWQEKDSAIIKKWNNVYLKELVESKKGMKLEKQFGDNIFIYKPEYQNLKSETNNNFQNSKLAKTGKSVTQQLPLTDWANNFAYYKEGWSRGRYDFWRKHLFTELRQDFIYTDKTDSVLSGKIDQKGDYEVWVRSLVGGTQGSYQLSVNSYQYTVTKDQGDERFIWKKIGDIKLDGQTNIEIKNISGENAIADIILQPK